MVHNEKQLRSALSAEPCFAQNNFDLIRLFAAAQVACLHTGTHLSAGGLAGMNRFLEFFPGVPVFFFVSGFLISRSFEKQKSLGGYFLNRSLRIFPALWLCMAVSLLLVWVSGYPLFQRASPAGFSAWVGAQLTCLQFYNPDFFRGYGVGVLNGSLWTISVELQFYVLVPMLYWLLERFDPPRQDRVLLCVLAIFMGLNAGFHYFESGLGEQVGKLVGVTFIPWFYMFLSGVWLQRNFAVVGKLLRFRHLLLPASAAGLVLVQWLGWSRTGNGIEATAFLLLATLVALAAYSAPGLSEQLLRRNDVSYGIYIYHMPLVNLLRHTGFLGNWGALLALAGTAVTSICSWQLVERRALAHKAHSLRAVTGSLPK